MAGLGGTGVHLDEVREVGDAVENEVEAAEAGEFKAADEGAGGGEHLGRVDETEDGGWAAPAPGFDDGHGVGG